MVNQTIAKSPSDITPWSWAEPLSPFLLEWETPAQPTPKKHTSWLGECPTRNVRVDHQLRAGVVGVEVTDRFRTIAEVLSRPIGDFQANRFFEFPAMLDTKAISQLVEAVRTSTGTQRDEAVYLRCMLLSELAMDGDNMKKLTHVETRFALDGKLTKLERHVGSYGDACPNGVIAAIDLSLFSALMTRKTTYQGRSKFAFDEWGGNTAVVPIKMEYSNSRSLLPYALSFVSSTYWNQRVAYKATITELGATAPRTVMLDCLPRAGQAVVGGPVHVLFVVIDVEVHPNDTVRIGLGGGKSVEVLGRSSRTGPGTDPSVREALLEPWLGLPTNKGKAPGRQRDAYQALEMLHTMVGTAGVFDTALNVATELCRTFFIGGGLAEDGTNSYGMSCFGDSVATGKRFGQGGPKVKKYKFDDDGAIGNQLEWIRFFFISPAGMLCEGTATSSTYSNDKWPQMNSFSCTAYSVVVSEADFEMRMARALQLVAPGTPSISPRQECGLSYWFSGNALLLTGATWGAYLSFGLDWAMLNGLITASSDLTTSVKKVVPLISNGRVTNCTDRKRSLYKETTHWTGYSEVTKNISTDDKGRLLADVQGFPLPMFIIRAVMDKLGLASTRPPSQMSFFDFDEDEDSTPEGVVIPGTRNWLFAPWMCDSIDFVRRKFKVITNAPLGKNERQVEVAVWPYAWADNVACQAATGCDPILADRIRLCTQAISGKFYAEAFLKRTTFVYVTNASPCVLENGEPHIDMTRPDPSTGFWQKAWSFLKGWVPKVISDVAPHVLTGNLPGVAFEVAKNVAEPVLEWLHKKKVDTEATMKFDAAGTGPGDGSTALMSAGEINRAMAASIARGDAQIHSGRGAPSTRTPAANVLQQSSAPTGPGGKLPPHAPVSDNLVLSPETGHKPFVSVDNPLPAAGPASGPNKE